MKQELQATCAQCLICPCCRERSTSNKIKSYHQRLTTVFGGEYWKDILYRESANTEFQLFQLVNAYTAKLGTFLPYTGYCPVREKSSSRIKDFIIFLSRHRYAMLLMNDIMNTAYFSTMHKADNEGTLWEALDWKDMLVPKERSMQTLKKIIKGLVSQYAGESRDAIWLKVVRSYFMKFSHSLYLKALEQLAGDKEVEYQVDAQTRRKNGNSKLYPTNNCFLL